MDSAIPAKRRKSPPAPTQALLAKLFHWTNLISLFIMLFSGLQIYNANPVFGGRGGWHFPDLLTLGGWLAGGRNWHFAAMWFYSLNLLWYGVYVAISRRWERRYASGSDVKALRVSQNAKRKTYALHRVVYTAIIPILLLSIASGLAMYKPAQFYELYALFLNWQTLRTIHFITVPIVVLFTFVHSLLAIKAGTIKLVKSMFL
jgi:thiosulfate reductase cytochrome b subunit